MAGRKEILTEQLAHKIAKMIELFPDNQIPVTWENVMAHSKKKFGHGFNRQMLGQKAWNGRKIIAEAFSEAKSVQRRMHNDSLPKYRHSPRTILQKRIAELEARNMALMEELEKVRAQQIDELDAFLNTPRDLFCLAERFATADRVQINDLKQGQKIGKQGTVHTIDDRWTTKRNNHVQFEADLLRLVERVIQESGNGGDFNASAWLKRWLSDPNPALNYATPTSYMDTIEGRDLVAGLLKKMQSGTFA